MSEKLEAELHEAMMNVYLEAKSKCHYNATYFLRMLNENRGVNTARILLSKEGFQYGFAKLWERGCIDITVECLVLNERFRGLFNARELDVPPRRLRECGFDPWRCERKSYKSEGE